MVVNRTMTDPEISLNGYQVSSAVAEVELEPDYNLARGQELVVKDSEGNVLYQDVRGFLPLTEETHIIRQKDGSWWAFFRSTGKKRKLQKVNLKHGNIHLMFDERGKIRYNQESYAYPYMNVA
jgi:hypothetical protein